MSQQQTNNKKKKTHKYNKTDKTSKKRFDKIKKKGKLLYPHLPFLFFLRKIQIKKQKLHNKPANEQKRKEQQNTKY